VQEVKSLEEMQCLAGRLRAEGKSIGLVPTMGYFHEGHLSLMRAARRETDVVIVSLFVNPLQFGPTEDYDRYPRDVQRDARLAEAEGVDVLWCPEVAEMYPPDFSTYVEETDLSRDLCGRSRPGHFRGVATVVLKLFNIVRPHRAYFGMKDYQQLRIVERMCRDLNLEVEIVRCPLVREADGLAMSSRNVYLSPQERAAALALSRSLFAAEAMVQRGETCAHRLRDSILESLRQEPLIEVDYVEVRDAESLKPVERIARATVIALAARVGKTRLIDNIIVGEKSPTNPSTERGPR